MLEVYEQRARESGIVLQSSYTFQSRDNGRLQRITKIGVLKIRLILLAHPHSFHQLHLFNRRYLSTNTTLHATDTTNSSAKLIVQLTTPGI